MPLEAWICAVSSACRSAEHPWPMDSAARTARTWLVCAGNAMGPRTVDVERGGVVTVGNSDEHFGPSARSSLLSTGACYLSSPMHFEQSVTIYTQLDS